LKVAAGILPPSVVASGSTTLAAPVVNIKPLNAFLDPSRSFARLEESKEETSRQTDDDPSALAPSRDGGINIPFLGQVKWDDVKLLIKNWLRNPKNLALLVWGIAVGIAGAILFMVMVGMLNAVLPKKAERDQWFEISNQILNALFTLLVLYLHPTRILHLVWLVRWRCGDIIKLRKVYCKGGRRKPHEWFHMLVVVLLLHLNCFSQYALCGLNWGYRRKNRPTIGVGVCLAFAIGAGAAAGIYNNLSPLGKDFENQEEEEDINHGEEDAAANKCERGEKGTAAAADHHHPSLFHLPPKYRLLERRVTFVSRDGKLVENPEWKGSLFDFCEESPTIAIASTLCLPCVLGWNLDRLGLGNRYVHVITFILLCSAPFLVFDIAAINVNNLYIRNSLGGSGIVLCVFGLLYGGYWRIQMRERFKLPKQKWCCGQPNMSDCTQWLFCSCCSLCQEVRTADAFEIRGNQFHSKTQGDGGDPSAETTATPDSVLLTPVPASSIEAPLPMATGRVGESKMNNTEGQTLLNPPVPQVVEQQALV
jgi:Cys-rich protein (TIGR01571 family)